MSLEMPGQAGHDGEVGPGMTDGKGDFCRESAVVGLWVLSRHENAGWG